MISMFVMKHRYHSHHRNHLNHSSNSMFHVEQFWAKFTKFFRATPDLFFFGLLVFCLPFGTRTFVTTLVPYSSEIFNEWTSVFLYATDILVILVLLLWLLRLGKFRNSLSKFARPIIFCFFAFIVVAVAAAILSPYPSLGLYNAARYVGFGLIFLYALLNIITHKRRLGVSLLVFGAGGIQAIIAISQFISQKSLGLSLFGESQLSTSIDNVAEVAFGGEALLRSYGTFPHPNVLAYFLIVSLFLGFYLFAKIQEPYLRLTIGFLAGLQFLALLLTFSRSAWFAAAVGLGIFLIVYLPKKFNWCKTKNCSTWNNFKCRGFCAGIIVFVIIAVVSLLALMPLIQDRSVIADTDGDFAVSYRQFLNTKALDLIAYSPIVGYGIGSFVPILAQKMCPGYPDWALQPIHNGYLWLWFSVGLIGLGAFFGIVILRLVSLLASAKSKIPKPLRGFGVNVPRGTFLAKRSDIFFTAVVCAVIGVGLITMLFDHYILDVNSGAMIWWIVLGL